MERATYRDRLKELCRDETERPVTVLAIDEETPFMPEFFQEVEQIRTAIEEIRMNVKKVKDEHVTFIDHYILHSTRNCSSK